MERIIETNVLLTAEGLADHATVECELECIQIIKQLLDKKLTIVLDDMDILLGEYAHKLNSKQQGGIGKKFYIWLFNYKDWEGIVKKIAITPIGQHLDDFEELPEEVRTSKFDRSDRKFVALALANNNLAPIVNAVDTDWGQHADLFMNLGITITEICDCDKPKIAARKAPKKRK